ncbi:predicted protein [Histoplasma capsulatum G186AR]|uniref:Aminoglycoside phosphotransferase domain-containing protein n=2 Tax=Ajellomyces capsulatus TaxID=5037 RepID=C0NAJ3_AJECG|nr:uncharacterized protein HCBG_00139 [Histoplasma capsulatum G186AR]EEH10684.1 predicted protein [Histoplasma capsulatum G186AR]KAG5288571.1 hypothetical protein I7I52_12095 [Histoplasma capsulatum]QSS71146.1 hypothetical protein I7I50_01881 [Histoplasma capsulatum G186AR]
MSSSTDKEWLKRCRNEHMPFPPFDRYIYLLHEHVVKKRLIPGELGYDGYEPEFSTISLRDENEVRTLELVRQYTNIPVPKLIHQGDGFNVFERIPGITVNESPTWDKVSPRQREAIKLQVQSYIKELAKVPNPSAGVRSLSVSGEIIHLQLPHRGPFESTKAFLRAYEDEHVPFIHQINPLSKPVLSHLDWDLSNIVLHPNLDAVAGVIDWERAAFFPEGGRSIHRMCHQWEGWETLFDGIEFPLEQ